MEKYNKLHLVTELKHNQSYTSEDGITKNSDYSY